MATVELTQDLAVRHRPPGLRTDDPPSFEISSPAPLPPSKEAPSTARTGELFAAPDATQEVVARAQMSVGLQRNLGNARMGAMVEEDGAASPQAAPAQRGAPAREKRTADGETEDGEGSEAAAKAIESGGATDEGGVELKMPEPPSKLTPAAQARVAHAQSAATRASKAHAKLPAAPLQVTEARGAVNESQKEADAVAAKKVVEGLGNRTAPSAAIEKLCTTIYEIINGLRPDDEDELVDAKPEVMGERAGGAVASSVGTEVAKVDRGYAQFDRMPAGTPQQDGVPIAEPPGPAPTGAIKADQAIPEPVPAKDLSLDADVAVNRDRMDQAGMNSEPAKLVTSGPIAEARTAQGELEQTAAEDPVAVMAAQEATLAKTGADLAALQQSAVAALVMSRKTTVATTSGQKHRMVDSEEATRATVGAKAQGIFNDARDFVNAQLANLPGTAKKDWDAGVKVATTRFKQELQSVRDWIDERQSGVIGTLLSVKDYFVGLPDWVTDRYNVAEKAFGDEICTLARSISTVVNTIVATCEERIKDADARIAKLYDDLPKSMKTWADSEKAKFATQLGGLSKKAHDVRDNFEKDLIRSATDTVRDVHAQVQALRKKAKGMVGRIVDAVKRFADDPVRFIIDGILDLLSIPPPAFWAVVEKIRKVAGEIADDPEKFANNLMGAVGQGFSQFFERIETHLLEGFIDWLTAGLASAGVALPKDASLKSIFTFLLELMGITWPKIRKILAKHLGDKNLALIEKVYSMVEQLIALGPEGIFELIKEKLDPQAFVDKLIQKAVDFMMNSVITAVSARILLLFNPVGAILQALEAIYRVLKWIFTNAARIFRLIETIVNGIADILAGNIGAMVNAVEKSLTGLIAPVIDFLADYLNFGDLPEKVRDTILDFQTTVEGILENVAAWLVEQGKALLTSVGLGGLVKEKEKPKEQHEPDIGEKVHFSAGGEEHDLWIVVQGTNAVLMVASGEGKDIEVHLTNWKERAEQLSSTPSGEGGMSPRAEAEDLIGKATTLATKTDKTVHEILVVIHEERKASEAGTTAGTAAPATPQQDKLSSEERQLAKILEDLIALIGPTKPQGSAKLAGRGSSARLDDGSTVPRNIREDLAVQQAMLAPETGTPLPLSLGDSRWPGIEGWKKMEQKFETSLPKGVGTMGRPKIVVHYVYSRALNLMDDFKIKTQVGDAPWL